MREPLDSREPDGSAAVTAGGPSTVAGGGPAVVAQDELPGSAIRCFHCGADCDAGVVEAGGRPFCCHGCRVVHELLRQSGLGQFYDLERHPGVRIQGKHQRERWAYLDDPEVHNRLLDYSDGQRSRVTFPVPAIHCVACVWLLENLFRLHPAVGQSRVDFAKREVTIEFAHERMPVSELAALLASIGYEPALNLGNLDQTPRDPGRRRRILQIGVAGFAFGNIMLFSVPGYLGFDTASGPLFGRWFGWLSLVLALPVLVFSASDYWRSALLAARQRVLTLEVPIALGLAALYGQSTFEVLTGRGAGYFDSLAGLVFFLLCGRAFQQRTYDRIAFDKDYRAFFPLSAVRLTPTGEEPVALSRLRVGDRLLIRHGELIPADARLAKGAARIDYSFVTGESAPVVRQEGDRLYAGGRQVGEAIEVEIVKPVSQSYLMGLWNHETFRKEREDGIHTLTNRFGRWFTVAVVGMAVAAGAFWMVEGQGSRGLRAFISVLIVACPCALALAAPFALGTAQRLLGRAGVFIKNPQVIERLATVDAVVFDKTGTLTRADAPGTWFDGTLLTPDEEARVAALTRQSTHPLAVRLTEVLPRVPEGVAVEGFREIPGLGLEGRVQGWVLLLGSAAFLQERGVNVPAGQAPMGSAVHLGFDGRFRGTFVLADALRPEVVRLVRQLGERYELVLLSGDNDRERERFRELFGGEAQLRFNQSPLAKLGFIERLQASGRSVLMVGDGLNDAGALRQSQVGVAVVERIGAFSPASDMIVEAARVSSLGEVLRMAAGVIRVIRWSFVISAVYNALGIAIAAAGWLSPVICAILMPISSVTVVGFASGATTWVARRTGLKFNPEQGDNTPSAAPGVQRRTETWASS